MEKIKKIFGFFADSFFEKVISAWLFASAVMTVSYMGAISLEGTNFATYTIVFVLCFLVDCCAEYSRKGISKFLLALSVFVFSAVILMSSDSIYTFIALGIFYTLAIHHYFKNKDGFKLDIPGKYAVAAVAVTAVLFFGGVTLISVLRYTTYSAPNYDFGIFANMYYNMKNSLRPLVSCERDQILSHFAIHFSPALYVFLPIYYIFPSSATVAVCQTLAVYSAVIPFALIMKHRKLPNINICLLSVVFVASAAFLGGCLFDFHENCLLVPFLMWMFYFYEKQKTPFVFLFAVLTLMVKEDAFVYVAIFAAYIIVADKNYLKGAILAVGAVLYFILACAYIENYGTGIMAYRYENLISGDEGLFGIIKTLFANPAYAVTQIFDEKNGTAEKLIYFLQLFSPVAFVPFFTKKKSRLILVLPILLNLLTDYAYQYNITFQYSFGISTMLMYLCILNVDDMKKKNRDCTSLIAAGLSVMMFTMMFSPKFSTYVNRQLENYEEYASMNQVLEQIPDDATVTASTFLIAHLCEREEIYEVYYTAQTDTDYLVLDVRSAYRDESLRLAQKWIADGYVLTDMGNEYIQIYTK
ncbi:MAG: DUF2079 domain-containing protein [Clostridia bacterium]|nr:DUF2079 domain-containing protein [Clostridia bacterium]